MTMKDLRSVAGTPGPEDLPRVTVAEAQERIVRALGPRVGTAEARTEFASRLTTSFYRWLQTADALPQAAGALRQLIDAASSAHTAIDVLTSELDLGEDQVERLHAQTFYAIRPALARSIGAWPASRNFHAPQYWADVLRAVAIYLSSFEARSREELSQVSRTRGRRRGPSDAPGEHMAARVAELYLAVFGRPPGHTEHQVSTTPFDRVCDEIEALVAEARPHKRRLIISGNVRARMVKAARKAMRSP